MLSSVSCTCSKSRSCYYEELERGYNKSLIMKKGFNGIGAGTETYKDQALLSLPETRSGKLASIYLLLFGLGMPSFCIAALLSSSS